MHRPTRDQLRETAERLRTMAEYLSAGRPNDTARDGARQCLREANRLERKLKRR